MRVEHINNHIIMELLGMISWKNFCELYYSDPDESEAKSYFEEDDEFEDVDREENYDEDKCLVIDDDLTEWFLDKDIKYAEILLEKLNEKDKELLYKAAYELVQGNLVMQPPVADIFVDNYVDEDDIDIIEFDVDSYIRKNRRFGCMSKDALMEWIYKYKEYYDIVFCKDKNYEFEPEKTNGVPICEECGNLIMYYYDKCPACQIDFWPDIEEDEEVDE